MYVNDRFAQTSRMVNFGWWAHTKMTLVWSAVNKFSFQSWDCNESENSETNVGWRPHRKDKRRSCLWREFLLVLCFSFQWTYQASPQTCHPRNAVFFFLFFFCGNNLICWICCYNSGGYEEFCLLVRQIQLTFRRIMSPPSSGSNSMPSKKPEWSRWLPSKRQLASKEQYVVTFKNIKLFIARYDCTLASVKWVSECAPAVI
jgi:hypothetical protein